MGINLLYSTLSERRELYLDSRTSLRFVPVGNHPEFPGKHVSMHQKHSSLATVKQHPGNRPEHPTDAGLDDN